MPNTSKMPVFKTSEFRVRKGLSMEKASARGDGACGLSNLSQASTKFRLLLNQGKGKLEGLFCKNSSPKPNSSKISMSKAVAISLKAMGTRRPKQAGVRETENSCYTQANKNSENLLVVREELGIVYYKKLALPMKCYSVI